ncbi:ThiS family protein [Stieleria maiorica]|uniref:ThiS family protein n=1 Tax=Stieleria maiorica TaxID=2795974 RepID=A0A5B9MCY5_9BACT|nr:MoaD/ThiS family protein [Stieleria maiorica]QEF97484.1 ThiS family protein [Stieleria maiorica]
MMTTVEIPSPLRQYCDGASEIRLSGATPNAILKAMEESHPELHRCVCNETGRVRPHVNLFINSNLIRGDEQFNETLQRGDVIGIFQAVSGG